MMNDLEWRLRHLEELSLLLAQQAAAMKPTVAKLVQDEILFYQTPGFATGTTPPPTIDTCNTATWPSTLTLTWPNGSTMTLTFNVPSGAWQNTSQPNYNRPSGNAYDKDTTDTVCNANGVAAKLGNVFLSCGGSPSRPGLTFSHTAHSCGSTPTSGWKVARTGGIHGIAYAVSLVSFTNSPVNIVYNVTGSTVSGYTDLLWAVGDTITIVQ